MSTPIAGVESAKSIAKTTGGLSRSLAELTTEPGEAADYADRFQAAFDEHADTLRRYANGRLRGRDLVAALGFSDRRGERAVRYLVTETDDSTRGFTDAELLDPDAFESLDRSVDHRVDLDWYLSRNAAAELERFVERFASRDRDPTKKYVGRTVAKYGDSVQGDLVDRLVDRYGGA